MIHVLFVVGILLIFMGKVRHCRWVLWPWFRAAHIVGIVVVQSWLGVICLLTIWEMVLREKAGEAVYAGSFISHWL
jgi:hypothetical protein